MTESAELEIQKQIYQIISEEPGLNLSKIVELLDLNMPLLLYHIRYLERHNLISVSKETGYTRCYIKGEVGVEDKKILSILRQEIPLKIVFFLLKNPHSKHKEILEHFDIAKSTLSYHLKKLVKNGIISDVSINEGQGFTVIDDEKIIRFLIKYKPSRVALGMKDTWIDFTVHKNEDKK